MQSSRSEILSGAIRNPTIMAMIGSAGIHGILVLFSALKPAESLPTPLRIVSIVPGGTAAGQPTGQPNGGLQMNGLPVPNGLPPINLGDVPELSTLPNLTELGKLSRSTYLGSNPSPIDLGKLSIKNPPQRSVAPNLPTRTYSIPKNFLGYQPGFNPSNFIGPSPSGAKPLNSPPDNSQYKVDPNPPLTRVSPGVNSPPFNGTPSATPTVPSDGSREISPQERGSIKTWAIAKGKELGQDLSFQSGPSLAATYPVEAGAGGTPESSARIAVLYGPDGSIKDIQTVQAADNVLMNAIAIDTAKAHSVQPTGAYQIVTYEVRLRPASALNGPLNGPLNEPETPKPTSTQIPSPESRPSVSPKFSPTPSAAPPSNSSLKEPRAEPKPSPTESNGPLIAPATPLSKDEILRRLTPKSSKAPEPSPADPPSPSAEPSPSTAPSPTNSSSSIEPLPSPSIEVPQSTPASP